MTVEEMIKELNAYPPYRIISIPRRGGGYTSIGKIKICKIPLGDGKMWTDCTLILLEEQTQ